MENRSLMDISILIIPLNYPLFRRKLTQQAFAGLEEVYEACLEDVLKTCLEDVFKKS